MLWNLLKEPKTLPAYLLYLLPPFPLYHTMATTVIRTPTTTFRPPSTTGYSSAKPNCITFLSYSRCGRRHTPLLPRRCRIHHSADPIVQLRHRSVDKFVIFASNEDVAEAAETETQEPELVQESEQEVLQFYPTFCVLDVHKLS